MAKKFASGVYEGQVDAGGGNDLGTNLVSYWTLGVPRESALYSFFDDQATQKWIQKDAEVTVSTTGQPSNLSGYATFGAAGSNDQMRISAIRTPFLYNYSPLVDSYTIAMWVRSSNPVVNTTSPPLFICQGPNFSSDPTPFTIYLDSTTQDLVFFVSNGVDPDTYVVVNSGTNVWDGQWHLITFGVDAGTVWYQLDAGTRTTYTLVLPSFTKPSFSDYSHSNYSILIPGTNANLAYSGDMSDVAIWGESLSEGKVTALYNSGNGLPVTSFSNLSACAEVNPSQSPSVAIVRNNPDNDCEFTSVITGTCSSPVRLWAVSYNYLVSGGFIENGFTGCHPSFPEVYATNPDQTGGVSMLLILVTCSEGCYPYTIFKTNSTKVCDWNCMTPDPQDPFTCVAGSAGWNFASCINSALQWQFLNGSTWEDVPGATSKTAVINNAGSYRLRVTCDGDDTTGRYKTLTNTVTCADCNVCSSTWTTGGSGCTLDLTLASGTCNTPTYQWQRDTGGGWLDMVGETSSTHTIVGRTDLGYVYRCFVYCADASICISSAVTVDKGVTISEPTSCNLTSTLYNTGDIPAGTWSYQWQLNGVDIPGATSSTYTATSSGNHRLRITDTGGCEAYSNIITTTCFTCTTFLMSAQTNNSGQACTASALTPAYVNMAGSTPAVGDIIYTVDGCTSPLDGNNRWRKLDDGLGTTYAVQVANDTGVITSVVIC